MRSKFVEPDGGRVDEPLLDLDFVVDPLEACLVADPEEGDLLPDSGLLVGFGLNGFLKSATTGFSAGRGIVSVGASVWLGAGLSPFPSVLEPEPVNEFEIILLVPDAMGEIVFGRMIELPGC